MRTEIVKLPSGASVTLRQISLKEENYLAGALRSRRAKQDRVLVDVVSRCCEGFDDPGPYPWGAPGGNVKWDDMLQGDFLAAMIALRKISYREGSEYEVELTCPSRACNHRFSWKVDLDTDLYYQDLPEESAQRMKDGDSFVAEIQGKKVHFNLGYVRDSAFQEKLDKRFPGRDMATMFRSRIVTVDGVDSKDLMNWLDGEGKGPYDGLAADDAEDLREAFYEADCGVDTEVEAECTRAVCGNVFTFDLPFDGMFSPGRAAARRKRRRRRGEPDAGPEVDSATS